MMKIYSGILTSNEKRFIIRMSKNKLFRFGGFMNRFLENMIESKYLYDSVTEPVCQKYGVSHTELDILLFLSNNPEFDTATDVIKKRKINKSSVSIAVRTLCDKGYVVSEFLSGNHRSQHLTVQGTAKMIVKDGRAAQEEFFKILTEGFSCEELDDLKGKMNRVTENIKRQNRQKTMR